MPQRVSWEQLDPAARAMLTELRAVPLAARSEVRSRARAIAGPALADAKRRASWSSRIPGAMYVQTRFTADTTRVSLKVRAAQAPHARAYENLGRPGTFRHPVHGRDVWVAQRARPFLFPAAEAHMERVYTELVHAVDAAARRAGF